MWKILWVRWWVLSFFHYQYIPNYERGSHWILLFFLFLLYYQWQWNRGGRSIHRTVALYLWLLGFSLNWCPAALLQVDFVIKEATNMDNLAQLYEGWTAWVWTLCCFMSLVQRRLGDPPESSGSGVSEQQHQATLGGGNGKWMLSPSSQTPGHSKWGSDLVAPLQPHSPNHRRLG